MLPPIAYLMLVKPYAALWGVKVPEAAKQGAPCPK